MKYSSLGMADLRVREGWDVSLDLMSPEGSWRTIVLSTSSEVMKSRFVTEIFQKMLEL